MASPSTAFRETAEFKLGRGGELVIARELMRRGWHVIPSYDYSGEDGNKAPRMEGTNSSHVLPDLDICKSGSRRWVEVKTKSGATWTRITSRFEHGIPLRHFESYKTVETISGCEAWLAIYEIGPPNDAPVGITVPAGGDVLIQKVSALDCVGRITRMKKFGRDQGGMIYFPRDHFRSLFRVETT